VRVIERLGSDNVYVSIYESDSTDATGHYLEEFKQLLTHRDIDHSIVNGGKSDPSAAHRIQHLANVRNHALEPLTRLKQQFDKIIFMNDVLFCADDVLALIAYAQLHGSDLTCGLDFDNQGGIGFYDTWVARDIDGRFFNKR
jgi:alpha-1,3-mannosyltransferase